MHACISLHYEICNVTCSAVKQYKKTTNILPFYLKLLLHKFWTKNFSKISSQTEMHRHTTMWICAATLTMSRALNEPIALIICNFYNRKLH